MKLTSVWRIERSQLIPSVRPICTAEITVPEISRFLGIVVGMFYNEHAPPHFHAVYGEHEATVDVESGLVRGHLPPRALALVREWAQLHRAELLENWQRARSREPLQKIAPLVTAMDYHIIEARHVRDYVVWLKFRDGTAGEIDLGPELRGPVFEPLRTQETFRSFRIDPEFHTLVWPNGADFAPEFLHDSVKVTA